MPKIRYRTLHHYKYQVMEDYCIQTEIEDHPRYTPFLVLVRDGLLCMGRGYAWDGASFLAIDTPSILRGSLVHDALYQLMREGHLPQSYRKYADKLLQEICLEDGMSRFRAWYVYRFVRSFGAYTAKPGAKVKDEIREAP